MRKIFNKSKEIKVYIPSLAILIILISLNISLSYSTTYYVDSNYINDNSDGLSWITPKKSINAALQNTSPGDQIWVREGKYNETIVMKSDIEVYGGFHGFEKSLLERNKKNRYSVIDATNAQNRLHVITYYFNKNTHLEGFKIMGGRTKTGTLSENSGGGIFYAYSDNTNTITNCEITSNTAEYLGGGILCAYYSSPIITGCLIYGNFANTGAGICFTDSLPNISNCKIFSNKASWLGGGLACMNKSDSGIDKCIISGNISYIGGGFLFSSANPKMTNCVISGNYSIWTGGAAALHTSQGIIKNCTISDNYALRYNSGIAVNLSSSPEIINNIFWNHSDYAIYEFDEFSDPVVINNIFPNNFEKLYFDFETKTISSTANINKIFGNRDNIDLDPQFVMDSKSVITGKWTTHPKYDSDNMLTILTDRTANFVKDTLCQKLINTNSLQYTQSLILGNSEKEIIVFGNVSAFTNENDKYKIIDYNLRYQSGAIDITASETISSLRK